jgi:hypothetical protein
MFLKIYFGKKLVLNSAYRMPTFIEKSLGENIVSIWLNVLKYL